MSEKGTINSIQNSNNNSKLIIIKKDRLTSAKGVINYITLKEGEQKLTMQINVIKGILGIKSNEINNKIILFNSDINNEIDIYLNNKKINMIKEDKKWIIDYNFQKEGIYQFEIVFNNIINNMNRFFEKCRITHAF